MPSSAAQPATTPKMCQPRPPTMLPPPLVELAFVPEDRQVVGWGGGTMAMEAGPAPRILSQDEVSKRKARLIEAMRAPIIGSSGA